MELDYYLAFDLPVPYRKLLIHPVTLKDFLHFNYYAQCLNLDKNSIPDVNIIRMSNLEYMFRVTQEDPMNKPYLIWFDRMLGICLKDPSFDDLAESMMRYRFDENGKPYFLIGEEKYTSVDYEELKKIIAPQNMVDLIDERKSKEVRDSLEEARRYKAKISGAKPGSVEDYIISLATITGWSFDYIYGMTIRKFKKSVRRLDNLIHYKIYLSASMSGMVEFKDRSIIKHWLTSIEEEDDYSDVSMELDEAKGKVSLESAKAEARTKSSR